MELTKLRWRKLFTILIPLIILNNLSFAAELKQTKALNSGESMEMTKSKKIVLSASNALTMAIDKAQELKYDLDKHWVVLTEKESGGWEVYLKPRKKLQRGGGITVHIDKDDQIERVQRWR